MIPGHFIFLFPANKSLLEMNKNLCIPFESTPDKVSNSNMLNRPTPGFKMAQLQHSESPNFRIQNSSTAVPTQNRLSWL